MRIAAVALLALASCYTIELSTPRARVVPLGVPGRVVVEPASARKVIAFRHGAVGIANRYRVRIGAALAAYAEVFLGAALAEGEGEPLVVEIVLLDAGIESFGVHLTARVEVTSGGAIVFDERYEVEAPSKFVGVSASERESAEAALTRATHEALALLLREVLVDLRAWLSAASAQRLRSFASSRRIST